MKNYPRQSAYRLDTTHSFVEIETSSPTTRRASVRAYIRAIIVIGSSNQRAIRPSNESKDGSRAEPRPRNLS
jgi:hypothetical protein